MSAGNNISATIFQAIKLFGGVQVVSNLCSVVLNKLVAIWIGPVGMGLFSLYNAAIDMLRSATSLGLRSSCVREVAIASTSGNPATLGRVIAIVKKWSWFASIFGAVTTMALAPLLSRWSFGTTDRIWDFILLASVLMFNGFISGEQAILQGSDRLRRLASASLFGTIGGLLCSIPLFYYLREDSILLSVIVYHAALLIATLAFRHKKYPRATLTNKEAAKGGMPFVKFGLMLTLSDFITMLFTYIFSAYLNRTAGTAEVGFYQSGFSLVGRYLGLIFTALNMEYYPRLARVCHSALRIRVFVSEEIRILMFILTPAAAIFLIARELIVSLLYSSEFHAIIPYITWAIVGTVFRAYSWCLAVTIIAKGDGRTFLFTETTSVVTGFVLNVTFYNLWGLDGLGFAYMTWYAAYCVITGFVYFRRYRYTLSHATTFISLVAFASVAAIAVLLEAQLTLFAIALTAALCAFSFFILRNSLRTKRH